MTTPEFTGDPEQEISRLTDSELAEIHRITVDQAAPAARERAKEIEETRNARIREIKLFGLDPNSLALDVATPIVGISEIGSDSVA